MCGGVAFFASQIRVLSLKHVAGLGVIELTNGLIPVHQLEISPVMFAMAPDAVLACGIAHLQLRMIAVPRRQELVNFLVAIQTFVSRLGGSKLMAARASRRSADGLVRVRKRAGGDLCAAANGSKHETADCQQRSYDPWQKPVPRVTPDSELKAILQHSSR